MAKQSNSNSQENMVSKEVSVTPALTALLKPTTEYLGLELREYVKGNLEAWKEKRRQKNLEAHLTSVREELKREEERTSSEEEPTIYQLTLFDEWMDGVQDVDPESEELSKIWRNLLVRAAKGEQVPTEVMAVLKTLSPKEAWYLFKLRKSRTHMVRGMLDEEDQFIANSLVAKGLLEKDYSWAILFVSMLAVFGVGVFIVMDNKISSDMSLTAAFGGAAGLVILALATWSGLSRWRTTWLCRELMKLVSREER